MTYKARRGVETEDGDDLLVLQGEGVAGVLVQYNGLCGILTNRVAVFSTYINVVGVASVIWVNFLLMLEVAHELAWQCCICEQKQV